MGEQARGRRRTEQPERAPHPRPSSGPPEPALLTLQRAVGNRATTALVAGARPVRRRVHRKLDLDATTWDGWFGGITGWRAVREGLQTDFAALEDALRDLGEYVVPAEERASFDSLHRYVTTKAKTPVPYTKGAEIELRKEIDKWTGVATALKGKAGDWVTRKQLKDAEKARAAASAAHKKEANRERAAQQATKRAEPAEREPTPAPLDDEAADEHAERQPAAAEDRAASFWNNFPELRTLYERLDELAKVETDEWIRTEWPTRTKKPERRAFRGELREWLTANQPPPAQQAPLTAEEITELRQTYTRAGIEAALRSGIVQAVHTQTYRTQAEAERTTHGDGGVGREFRVVIAGQAARWVFHTHSDVIVANGHQVHHAKPDRHGSVRFVTPKELAALAHIDRAVDRRGRNLTAYMQQAVANL